MPKDYLKLSPKEDARWNPVATPEELASMTPGEASFYAVYIQVREKSQVVKTFEGEFEVIDRTESE